MDLLKLFPTAGAFIVVASLSAMFARQAIPVKFEVASIKIFKPGAPPSGLTGCHGSDSKYAPGLRLTPPPLGRCVFKGTTLRALILSAYPENIPVDQVITGGPAWMGTDRYEIEAKAVEGAVPREAELTVMLQNLLAERFNLKFHRETRVVSGYALVQAKGGAKLKESTGNESITGLLRMGGPPRISAQNIPMTQWVNYLWRQVDSPVVDKTELTGRYNFTLLLTTNGSELKLPEAVADDGATSIFTALPDQLGLKLQAQKVQIEYFVVDSAEKPVEN